MFKGQVLKANGQYRFENDIYTSGDVSGNDYVAINKKGGGTDFHSRAKVPGTHSYFDSNNIYQQLELIFRDVSASMILDVGCGDGRTVIWFLDNTEANIIAVDCSYEALMRLKTNYLDDTPGYKDRVLLIHSNIMDMPIKNSCCDFIFSFEVYCYLLDDYEKGFRESLRALKPNGHFVTAERNKAFGLLHELLNRGPKGMIETNQSSNIIDHWNDDVIYTRVLDHKDNEAMLNRNGLTIKKTYGVSFYSVITAFLKAQGLYADDIQDMAPQLADIFSQYSSSEYMHRSTIYLTQKN